MVSDLVTRLRKLPGKWSPLCREAADALVNVMLEEKVKAEARAGGGAMDVLDEVRAERARQDEQWGGAQHDDDHTLDTWWDFLEKHWEKFAAAFGALQDADLEATSDLSSPVPTDPKAVADLRHRAIVVAALMVALVESNDRTYSKPDPQRGEQ